MKLNLHMMFGIWLISSLFFSYVLKKVDILTPVPMVCLICVSSKKFSFCGFVSYLMNLIALQVVLYENTTDQAGASSMNKDTAEVALYM
jgi:hypothetical protein